MTESQKRSTVPPIVYILLGLGLTISIPKIAQFIPEIFSKSVHDQSRMSFGEKNLIALESIPEKQKGIDAYARQEYGIAAEQFESALKKQRNSPETVIYRNNAKAYSKHRKTLKIAVSVPISTNPNVASEILRGVAQAQDEINNKGGIQESDLVVMITDDSNDPDIAKKIAWELTKNSQILAVIGHNASNVSLSAAPIYQQAGLVMMTSTSFAGGLSGIGNYIFRTVPTSRALASRLAEYVVKISQERSVAVCYDSQSPDSISFRDEFYAAIADQGGLIVPTICDFISPTFNPTVAIQEIRRRGAKSILLVPHINRIQKAIELARTNQDHLSLFSSSTLYTFQTLRDGKADVNGLILPAAWHPQAFLNRPFAQAARQYWGGEVAWRTATSYDAVQAICAGLQQSPSRSGLQRALRNPSFRANGAGEPVSFDAQTGDRKMLTQLVQIQKSNSSHSGTGYDFLPILKTP